MATYTAVDGAETGLSACWCCGAVDPPERQVHLGNHPEVGLCLRCARWAAQQARAVEDADHSGLMVRVRDGVRLARQNVVRRGWHRSRLFGRPLRWLGKRLP